MKLIRPEGEIDFVASPNLTDTPFEVWQLLGHTVRVETAAEIVAKKLWHRGDRVTARDLFDLSLVIEREPEALAAVSNHLIRHRSEFLQQLQSRSGILKLQFEAIDVLTYRPSTRAIGSFLIQSPADALPWNQPQSPNARPPYSSPLGGASLT